MRSGRLPPPFDRPSLQAAGSLWCIAHRTPLKHPTQVCVPLPQAPPTITRYTPHRAHHLRRLHDTCTATCGLPS